jgi:hypothetical protein
MTSASAGGSMREENSRLCSLGFSPMRLAPQFPLKQLDVRAARSRRRPATGNRLADHDEPGQTADDCDQQHTSVFVTDVAGRDLQGYHIVFGQHLLDSAPQS